MSEQILQRLDALAVKLGVTAQYLWGVLVKQAQVEFYTDFGLAILFLLTGVLSFFGARRCFKNASKDRYNEDGWFGCGIACSFGVIVATILSIVGTCGAITEGVNPEYWALQQVLKTLSK